MFLGALGGLSPGEVGAFSMLREGACGFAVGEADGVAFLHQPPELFLFEPLVEGGDSGLEGESALGDPFGEVWGVLLGHPIPRTVSANLESGRRANLPLVDVVVGPGRRPLHIPDLPDLLRRLRRGDAGTSLPRAHPDLGGNAEVHD